MDRDGSRKENHPRNMDACQRPCKLLSRSCLKYKLTIRTTMYNIPTNIGPCHHRVLSSRSPTIPFDSFLLVYHPTTAPDILPRSTYHTTSSFDRTDRFATTLGSPLDTLRHQATITYQSHRPQILLMYIHSDPRKMSLVKEVGQPHESQADDQDPTSSAASDYQVDIVQSPPLHVINNPERPSSTSTVPTIPIYDTPYRGYTINGRLPTMQLADTQRSYLICRDVPHTLGLLHLPSLNTFLSPTTLSHPLPKLSHL
jgi:hypothetical protein